MSSAYKETKYAHSEKKIELPILTVKVMYILYYIPPKQKIGSGPSANNITAIKCTDNLKVANSTMPSVGDFQAWNQFTHILGVGKCHKTISKRMCNHETGSLTLWEYENGTRPSAKGSVAMKQVHLLPESKKMWQHHQQENLQLWNRFTHWLWAGKCHKTIRRRTCSHEAGPLTSWEQKNATTPSARGPAAMKQVHLLPESRKMPQDHQKEDLQLWNRFTYILSAGICHKTISKRICNHETGSLTNWEQENMTRPWAKDLQPWNRFAYSLIAGKYD